MKPTYEQRTGLLAALSLAVALTGMTAHAQSAKVSAQTADFVLLPPTNSTGGWQTILAANIQTAMNRDLFIGASLEVGLFTSTTSKSKNLATDVSLSKAQVDVQVLVDGTPAQPGMVVFGRRSQQLSTTLEGAIGNCLTVVTNLDGTTSVVVDTNCVTEETIELIIDSTDAASFNFVAPDVPVGPHTVVVQARVDTSTDALAGSAEAMATVGKGSLTVESVRLVRGAQVGAVP